MTVLQGIAAIGVVLTAMPSAAQQTYRCGNTYSQIPCSQSALPLGTSGNSPAPTAVSKGRDLCRSITPRLHDFKDPYSLVIESVVGPQAVAVKVAGEPLMAQRYLVMVNAKNSYGAYVGVKAYACYLSVDHTRHIANAVPAERAP